MRFGSLTRLLSLALVFGCGETDPASAGTAQKTCSAAGCCFFDDDCAEGEYCDGDGPCDSEGSCKPHVNHPCPLEVDPVTGVPNQPVCGCDGVTYQGACQATTSGVRIGYVGVCDSGPFGNTTVRVDTVYGDLELASMDADFGCYTETDPRNQLPPDIYISGGLELQSNDDGESLWEGVFDLPLGVCTLTLRLTCNGEVLCLGSQNVGIEADTVLDVVLPCSAGPPVCDGTGRP